MAERFITPPPSTTLHFLAIPNTERFYIMAWQSGRESIPEELAERALAAAQLEQQISVVSRPRLCSVYFAPPLSRDEALRFSAEFSPLLGHVASIQTVQLLQAGHPSTVLETVPIDEITQADDEGLRLAA